MFLSNRDIQWAIDSGKLTVEPRPERLGCGYDPVSIDLHLDDVNKALVWDHRKLAEEQRASGATDGERPTLHLGSFEYKNFAGRFLTSVPPKTDDRPNEPVFRNGGDVYVRPGGFLLWSTKEKVGTPDANPELIGFVNAKSTKARTGIVVHLTAPTIESGWTGTITLEIANFGPFTFVLRAGDAIAALTVATISSNPDAKLRAVKSATHGQVDPTGKSR